MKLCEILKQIQPADQQAFEYCIKRFDNIAKPVGSLGKLETLLATAAAAQGNGNVDISKKAVLVFCADNGVLAQGVAQSTHDVTTAIAKSLARQTTSVNSMAKAAKADVFAIDMGIVDSVEGLIDRRLAAGTSDITQGPAMTREMAETAILTGIEMVKMCRDKGYKIIATGEAGIGNTTTSSAVTSVLLDCDVQSVTGRGSGLSDEGLNRKINAINKAIETNKPDKNDVIDVLCKVGGFDIAGMTGAFIGGALYNIPVIMDGFIGGVAAVCAVRLCECVKGYILPSHITAEPAGIMIMKELGFEPILHGDMRLGEGTGAVALMPLLDLSLSVYENAATFGDIKVEAYKKWKSN
ncbi:MAG: nicotinate-nucleotide--dimethylbenzimidazole phosphoribosyltransferase [Oscillospiraceae bacterium]|nr:nicotinate-nucleotide--dimethylbenzimidazole phosphoribosyltransferase [Oscillospiraceae bacterium]